MSARFNSIDMEDKKYVTYVEVIQYLQGYTTKEEAEQFIAQQKRITELVGGHECAIQEMQKEVQKIEPLVQMVRNLQDGMDSVIVMLKKHEEEFAMSYSRFRRIEEQQEVEENKVKKLDSRVRKIETTFQAA